ncbi:MAG: hypothetical protein LBI78_07040 [Campylobacteraceae bacterium]|jgi:hypothetical protein|nr:hypothetical protein [Campylobacteraceae bacterium]
MNSSRRLFTKSVLALSGLLLIPSYLLASEDEISIVDYEDVTLEYNKTKNQLKVIHIKGKKPIKLIFDIDQGLDKITTEDGETLFSTPLDIRPFKNVKMYSGRMRHGSNDKKIIILSSPNKE